MIDLENDDQDPVVDDAEPDDDDGPDRVVADPRAGDFFSDNGDVEAGDGDGPDLAVGDDDDLDRETHQDIMSALIDDLSKLITTMNSWQNSVPDHRYY